MRPFLTAAWQNLINITYAVEQHMLAPYLPNVVELNTAGGLAFISLVSFKFLETKFYGIKIPHHVSFPEINIRFYVKRGEKRGVIFMKEFVPKYFVRAVANAFFHERYELARLESKTVCDSEKISVSYFLKKSGGNYFISAEAENKPFLPSSGSTEYFFENRYYGFSQNRKKETLQFYVDHPQWEIYPLKKYTLDFDFAKLMGSRWAFLNSAHPDCAMLIRGSRVKMFPHKQLHDEIPFVKKPVHKTSPQHHGT